MLLGTRNTVKTIGTLGSISVAVLLLAACGQQQSKPSSHINVAISAELQTLDPDHVVETTGDEVLKNTQEGLVVIGKHNQVTPGVAKSWQVSADGKQYSFTLRRNAKWNNGKAVTARDFVYAWRRAVNPQTKSENAYRFSGITGADQISSGKLATSKLGVQAVGKYKLVVHLDHPLTAFMQEVAEPAFGPLQKATVSKYGSKYGTDARYVASNGPFVVKKWHGTSDSWTLVKNPQYWNHKQTKLTAVTYHVLKTAETGLNMYESGQLDQTTLTGSQVANEKRNKGFVNVPSGTNVYVQFNQKTPTGGASVKKALNNVNIRKALSLTLNRKEFVQKTLDDGSIMAKGLVTSGMASKSGTDFADAAYVQNPRNNGVAYDKQLAKALWQKGLQEVGLKKLALTLTMDDDDTHDTIVQYLQGAWTSDLKGLDVTIKKVPKPTRIKDMQSGTFDVIVAGWSPDYADPASFLDIFTSSNPYNIGGYNNAASDKQMQIADTTADTNTRWNAMVKAEQIIMQDQGVLPLYQLSTAYLRNPKIKGVVHNAAAADPGWRGVSINK
ncbi:peptide ABC transporter substrate-binding protein [Lacticaseibacillus songhuajiangensis]|jgi:oligopeptide transport system substrate-binding protein|uniref:peptide ABC transporter substrate-binding protein n=1 Tax=Lacticaseibacillus songhuajiangensis TaxID=1296539 RepID=UPI000F7B9E5E|nr:peptide ABC transporter substrate-binding protein [Lacticaseibacillus songhuajiangensis]